MSTTPHLALAASPDAIALSVSSQDPSETHTHPSTPQWVPTQNALSTLFELLKLSTTAESAVQSRLFAQLQQYAAQKDFNSYLTYILVVPEAASRPAQNEMSSQDIVAIRQAAGFLLKGNIRQMYSTLHPDVQAYVSTQLINGIGDNSEPIRDVVASCISTLVLHNRHLVSFARLITTLVLSLDSSRPSYLDGSLTVLSRIAEDAPNLLTQDSSQPLDTLLPKIFQLCRHHTHSVRVRSLQILNHLVLVMPPALQANVDVLCNTLFSIAEDPSPQVRKRVCTAICLLLNANPNALAPYITSVIEFMLLSSSHPDEQVAKEASEFWSLFAEREGPAGALRPYLPKLIPILLTNMVYSVQDRAAFDPNATPDDMVPDGPEDIRPRFHKAQLRGPASSEGSIQNGAINQGSENGSGVANNQNGFHGSEGSEDEDDEGSDEAGVGEEPEWNLRRCSAAALDALSGLFNDEILDILLPILQEKLTDTEHWEERESGVLALGAIAEGCSSGMAGHMQSIFPFLLHSSTDQHIMVRCISCWALSRYGKWVIKERDDALYQQLLKVLLDRMLDRYKVVQKASCSALATFEEESGPMLSSYLTPILRSLTPAFERYQKTNMCGLYDVVCALADAVGNKLATPEHMNVIMPPLMSKWNSCADDDLTMLPLLECLAILFRAIGGHSQQFASNVFSRCANIMDVVYSKESNGQQEDTHAELLAYCLDLMCSLAEVLGPAVDPLVAKTGNGSKPVLPLLFVAMRDSRHEVRQSAFALLGEFAKARMPSLIPALPEYVNYVVNALNPDYLSVSNNATWALGELIMMAGFLPAMVRFDRDSVQRTLLERAADPLIRMVNAHLNKTLLENTAITIGRLGLVMPEQMAPKLASFAEPVFLLLRNITDDVEKEQAFHGMNSMVRMNPAAILECFVYYVDAIASWYHCKPDLEIEFATILTSYKTSLGEQWVPLFNTFTSGLQQLLKDRFRL